MARFSLISGQQAEQQAQLFLKAQGLSIVATHFFTRHGEIDIIAEDQDVLVFVEVKKRQRSDFGTALESVTFSKQKKLQQAASEYLARQSQPRICRFDVLSQQGNEPWQWIKDAF